MKIQIQSNERPLIPEGVHLMTLDACELKTVKSPYSKRADGMEDRLIWVFLSDLCDDNGDHYEYVVWTGTTYGNEKASMTLLLDQLMPGLTDAVAANLTTSAFVQQRYRARIVHKTNNVNGKKYATHLFIEPLDDKGRVGTSVTECLNADTPESSDDPFVELGN